MPVPSRREADAVSGIVRAASTWWSSTTAASSTSAAARNRGAAASRAELVAFTDDDCCPEPGWLRGLVARLQEHPGALVGGRVVNALVDNPYAAASQLVHDLVYAHNNREPGNARTFASNNMAVRRRELQGVGGFDEKFGRAASEDRELCDRWRHRGGHLVYAPGAVVRHAHHMGLRGYVRQHFNYGAGASRYHALRSERGSGRFVDELAFHLTVENWRRGLVELRRRPRSLRTAGLLVVWQVANAAGFLADRLGWVSPSRVE